MACSHTVNEHKHPHIGVVIIAQPKRIVIRIGKPFSHLRETLSSFIIRWYTPTH